MIDIFDTMAGSGNFYVAIGGALLSYFGSRLKAKKDKRYTERQTQSMISKERLMILQDQNIKARFDDLVSKKIKIELDIMKSELYRYCEYLLAIEESNGVTIIPIRVKNYVKKLTPRQVFLDYNDGLKRAFKLCDSELTSMVLYDDIKGKSNDELRSAISDTAINIQHRFIVEVQKSAGSCDIFSAADEKLNIELVHQCISRIYDFALRHSGYITRSDADEDIINDFSE